MKPVFSIAAAAALGCCACNQPAKPVATTDPVKTEAAVQKQAAALPDLAADAHVLDISLKPYDVPEQRIQVAADKPKDITGVKGTVIHLNPADLETEDGTPAGKNIDLTLVELTDKYDMLRNNAQTASGGQMLVSGGAYYIGCSTNGHAMRLKPGRKLAVNFPRKSKESMQLFYGNRDSAGNMNWQPSSAVLRPSDVDSVTETVAVYKTRDSLVDVDAYDARNAYGVHVVNGEARLMKPGETIVTDTEYVTRRVSKSQRLDDELYAQVMTDKMGWINCDRFYTIPQPADLLVKMPSGYDRNLVRIFIVFKNMNSVLSHQFYPGASTSAPFKIDRLPVNEPVRIIAFTVAGGLKGFSKDITLAATNEISLEMAPVTDDAVKKLIKIPVRG